MAQYPGTINPTSNCTAEVTFPCPYYEETYSEGVMVGYRWYDDQRIMPLDARAFSYWSDAATPGVSRPAATRSRSVAPRGS